jgi:branched-chain amino acid transport system ATP-binding protein
LLDEPAAGLDTAESQHLGALLRQFVERGTTIFLIDHDMGLVLNVCDYIYVLDFGRIIAEGTPAEIRKDPAVVAAYLGESAGEAQAREGAALAAPPPIDESVTAEAEASVEAAILLTDDAPAPSGAADV